MYANIKIFLFNSLMGRKPKTQMVQKSTKSEPNFLINFNWHCLHVFDKLKWAGFGWDKSRAKFVLEIGPLSDLFEVSSTRGNSEWQRYEQHNQRTNCQISRRI